MPPPAGRAVVIPFGVPDEGRGLGLGLAALVHAFVHVEGQGVALAQLHGRKKGEPESAPPAPVEAFVPPEAWSDIARRGGDAPDPVGLVLTGALEPPLTGSGAIQLLAYDSRDGSLRARVDAPLDAPGAGAALVGALEQISSRLGGEIGALGALRDLEWESLESVLRAERCALHDPLRGEPHDTLAAMMHLERAVEDAPGARYPAERLAAIALETASGPALDPRIASAAARALERAVEEGHRHVELVESLAALLLRLGRAREAERRLNAALARDPDRGRLYVMLAQALRAQGQLDAALATLASADARGAGDVLLSTERGAVLAARGDLEGAKAAWRDALARDPVLPAPFASLGALALRSGDAQTAQQLVDAALAAPRVHVDVLRRAVHLSLATESDGLARASRVARLCGRLLEIAPADAWASLALARAQLVLGDRAPARARLASLEQTAPESAAAAEAQALRMLVDDPSLEAQAGSVRRAAQSAPKSALEEIAARARRVGTLHGFWPAWAAAAAADRRRGKLPLARAALETALDLAPGATQAHLELGDVLLALDDAQGALSHGERVLALEGESPRALRLVARALEKLGRLEEARSAAVRAAALDPGDAPGRELLDRLRSPREQEPWSKRLAGKLRWRTRR